MRICQQCGYAYEGPHTCRSYGDVELTNLRAQVFALTLRAEQAEQRAAQERSLGCPCVYVGPCSPACTCVTPVLSGGCQRCCRYGSDEQKHAMAEYLVQNERRVEQAERERDEVRGMAHGGTVDFDAARRYRDELTALRARLETLPRHNLHRYPAETRFDVVKWSDVQDALSPEEQTP